MVINLVHALRHARPRLTVQLGSMADSASLLKGVRIARFTVLLLLLLLVVVLLGISVTDRQAGIGWPPHRSSGTSSRQHGV